MKLLKTRIFLPKIMAYCRHCMMDINIIESNPESYKFSVWLKKTFNVVKKTLLFLLIINGSFNDR